MTAARILGLLRERHSDPEWVFFSELATSGTNDTRYMDAFVINVWKSNKFRRIAYEIKVSRADLMKELTKDPEKRLAAMKLSNLFFYVVPAGLVDKKEIPEGCGLIEANKGGLRTKLAAKYREVDDPNFAFVARMVQRLKGYGPPPVPCFKYAGREMTEEEFRDLVKQSQPSNVEWQIQDKVKEGIALWKRDNHIAEVIDYLKKESGQRWGGVDLKELKAWLDGIRTGVPIKDLQWIAHNMKDVKNALDRILGKIPKEKDPYDDEEEEETEASGGGDQEEANPVLGGDGEADPGGKENADEKGDQDPGGVEPGQTT